MSGDRKGATLSFGFFACTGGAALVFDIEVAGLKFLLLTSSRSDHL